MSRAWLDDLLFIRIGPNHNDKNKTSKDKITIHTDPQAPAINAFPAEGRGLVEVEVTCAVDPDVVELALPVVNPDLIPATTVAANPGVPGVPTVSTTASLPADRKILSCESSFLAALFPEWAAL